MALGTFIHLEHDGKLLLVDSEGKGPQIPIKGGSLSKDENGWIFRLPTNSEVESMGIEWTLKGKYNLDIGDSSTTIIMGQPEISWPKNWAWKDDVISDSCVHPAARESVYRSIHRLVSKVVIELNSHGLKDMGKVIAEVVKRSLGSADGKTISDIVKQKLSN